MSLVSFLLATNRLACLLSCECRQYGDWTIEGCNDADEYGWQVLSDAYVTTQLGVTLSNYDFM